MAVKKKLSRFFEQSSLFWSRDLVTYRIVYKKSSLFWSRDKVIHQIVDKKSSVLESGQSNPSDCRQK